MRLDIPGPSYQFPPALFRNLSIAAAAGVIISAVGVLVAPERAWPNILLASYYVLSLGLAAVFFIALQYVSNAGWSVAIRRIPEAMTQVLPLGAVLMLATLLGTHTLYEWSHESAVEADHLLQSKAGWLDVPFFVIRTVAYLAVWLALAAIIVRLSRRQDADSDVRHTHRNRKWSAAFIVIFSVTFTLASMDWIMSLEPHWYSTIFGVYNFSGLLLNGLAVITVLVILLRRWGPLRNVVNESHLHDLGKLVFAFSTFWMYIWFSQYLLIWYANIPEEVVYFVQREEGAWLTLTGVNVVFNWVIPFVVLLPRWTKRNEGMLLKVCVIVMIGHWIDLFWMILPPFMKGGPEFGLWEFGPIAGTLALFFLVGFRSFTRAAPIPVKDPLLVESLQGQER
ncbi:MAG: hypothetical protein KAJ12_14170 [Bacteroidetes bacterium]|nr:hypothetical protein [Bacteroidota bacterium]